MMKLAAHLPFYGSKKKRDAANLLEKSFEKMESLKEIFYFFLNTEFIYEAKVDDFYMSMMSPEDRDCFWMDVKDFKWADMIAIFAYGIRKYYIKEDMLCPRFGEMEQIV